MSSARQIGPYLVVGELGRGAMGVVYRVQDASGRQLALKLIQRNKGDSEILERFAREAQTMARINHKHVIRVHELGDSPQGPFIVTEIVDGPELQDVLRNGPFDPDEAAQIARKLADALAALHSAGIIHRDLKPGNVILKREDREPVLLDFGLARDDSQDRLTKTGTLLGTPNYMAPEQANGATSQQGPWTDVYGLGAILFALLSGRAPFTGGVYEVLQKVMEEAPTWPSAEREVPLALEAIVRKAMAKDPARRYTNATELRDELDRYIAGDWSGLGVAAPPPDRTKLLLGLGGVLLLGGAIGGGLWATRSPAPAPTASASPTPTASPTPSAPPKPPRDATFTETSTPADIAAWLKAWPDHPRAAETRRVWLQAKLNHPLELNRYRGVPEQLARVGGKLYGATLTTRNTCTIRVWNLAHRQHEKPRDLRLLVAESWARDRDRKLLVLGGQTHPSLGRENLFLFPAGATRPVARRLSAHHVIGVALSPDGSRLVIYGPVTASPQDRKVVAWLVQVYKTADVLKSSAVEPLHTTQVKGQIRGVGMVRDNATVVILRYPPGDNALPVSFIELWNTADGSRLRSPAPLRGEPAYLVPHPDGWRFLVAVSSTYQLALIDVRARPLVLDTHRFLGAGAAAYKTEALKGTPAAHNSTLRESVFSPDGTRLYSVSGHAKPGEATEGELRIWDVETKQELAKRTKLDERFSGLDVLDDGRLVTTATRPGPGKPLILLQAWDVREQP